LRRTEVLKLIRADQFATRTGRHLCTFVTVRWAETTLGEAAINRRFSAVLNASRIWASRRGIEWAAISVHENPPAASPAFNSHVLCSIPASQLAPFAAWLVKQLGGTNGAVHVRPRTLPGWDADETLSYCLKGTDFQTAKHFRLITKKGWKHDQGIVPFRRCTVTRNLSSAAIAAWKAGEFRYQYARAMAA